MSIEYSDNQTLIAELKGFRTLSELRSSKRYQYHKAYLSTLLETPCLFPARSPRPRINDFVRIAHWNIEKGKHLDSIIKAFRDHPILSQADLISINEADVGMNRSRQRFVAREIGEELGMHVLFAPAYLEFSKGYGEDLKMPGENTIALQGNAILSNYPLRNPRTLKLPDCFNHFEHGEKRIGTRNALSAEIDAPGGPMILTSTHLEVRDTPICRAHQMKAIIEELEQPGIPEQAIIAGDFNTHGTARGGWWRTLQASLRLSFANKERVKRIFANPQTREPLFDVLHRHNFTELGFNDSATTCITIMRGLEDRTALPKFLADAFEHRMARFNHRLDLRLDWIVGRGVKPLSDGEVVDRASGVHSRSPRSISGLKNESGDPISDHDPITADIELS
jgi:endonuclease/exonuclease/phosphatase family metal-dependent hydrolase